MIRSFIFIIFRKTSRITEVFISYQICITISNNKIKTNNIKSDYNEIT